VITRRQGFALAGAGLGAVIGPGALETPTADAQVGYYYCINVPEGPGGVCRDPNNRPSVWYDWGVSWPYNNGDGNDYPVCVAVQYYSSGWHNYYPWYCDPSGYTYPMCAGNGCHSGQGGQPNGNAAVKNDSGSGGPDAAIEGYVEYLPS
jgi:hypothetical protein